MNLNVLDAIISSHLQLNNELNAEREMNVQPNFDNFDSDDSNGIDDSDDSDESDDLDDEDLDNKCPICLDLIINIDVCLTKCNHKFHTSCLMKVLTNECPLCRLSLINVNPVENDNTYIPEYLYTNEGERYVGSIGIPLNDFSSFMNSLRSNTNVQVNNNQMDQSTNEPTINNEPTVNNAARTNSLTGFINNINHIINKLAESLNNNSNAFNVLPKILLIISLSALMVILLTPVLLTILICIVLYK
jgi:hypothetical protein